MIREFLDIIKKALILYALQERTICNLESCLPQHPNANSSLLRGKLGIKYTIRLANLAIIGIHIGTYNYNRESMQKLIKELVRNNYIRKIL